MTRPVRWLAGARWAYDPVCYPTFVQGGKAPRLALTEANLDRFNATTLLRRGAKTQGSNAVKHEGHVGPSGRVAVRAALCRCAL